MSFAAESFENNQLMQEWIIDAKASPEQLLPKDDPMMSWESKASVTPVNQEAPVVEPSMSQEEYSRVHTTLPLEGNELSELVGSVEDFVRKYGNNNTEINPAQGHHYAQASDTHLDPESNTTVQNVDQEEEVEFTSQAHTRHYSEVTNNPDDPVNEILPATQDEEDQDSTTSTFQASIKDDNLDDQILSETVANFRAGTFLYVGKNK